MNRASSVARSHRRGRPRESRNAWIKSIGSSTPTEYRRLLREWLALGPLDERAYWWFVSLMLGAEARRHAGRLGHSNHHERRGQP
jgi:hypothetical protein